MCYYAQRCSATDDSVADVEEAVKVFREIRSKARQGLANTREQRREVRRLWEADCVATDKGVTARLMRKHPHNSSP